MQLSFWKYEGIGNDFLVVERGAPGASRITPAVVARLCDRHRGVGGDGVLLVGKEGARPSMTVVNADGSIPEMCGNGLRCVALHVVRRGLVPGPSFVVDTDAGPHQCHVRDDGTVEVQMRVPSLDPRDVPCAGEGPLLDAALAVDGTTLHLTAVSMGNPHAVTFDPVGDARRALGPRLEKDPRFPAGVNVGFATVVPGGLDLHVWERGAGFTEACGTGACAAAVAAVETGRASRGTPIDVRLPGGTLTIRVGSPGEPVRMTGPARFVFEGALELSRFEGAE